MMNRETEKMNDGLVRAAEQIVRRIEPHAAVGGGDKEEVLRILRMWRKSLKAILGLWLILLAGCSTVSVPQVAELFDGQLVIFDAQLLEPIWEGMLEDLQPAPDPEPEPPEVPDTPDTPDTPEPVADPPAPPADDMGPVSDQGPGLKVSAANGFQMGWWNGATKTLSFRQTPWNLRLSWIDKDAGYHLYEFDVRTGNVTDITPPR